MRMVLHSDQGSVYASKDFNELLPMYNVVRSMSRAGTPTDNAAMEAINGWIKAEVFMDFHVTGNASVEQEVDDYIVFFNEQRVQLTLMSNKFKVSAVKGRVEICGANTTRP